MTRSRSKETATFLVQQSEGFLHEGAIYAKANARVHFDGAKLLMESGSNGLAVSHFILSIEESIKAHALMTYALKANKDLEPLAGAFSSHREKHRAASLFASASALLAPIAIKLSERISEDSEEKKDITTALANWARNINFESLLTTFDLEWWKNANATKEKGFYVDVDRDSKVWLAPNSISGTEITKARDVANSVLERVELLFEVSFDSMKSIARNTKYT